MNKAAAKTLVTSKGTVRAGQDIPEGLARGELRAIGAAGGIAPEITKVRPGDAGSDERGDAFKAAVDRVRTAEAEFEAARADEALTDEARQGFEDALIQARQALYALS